MPYYESVFIARQDISATQVDTLADGFAKAVEDQGGKIAKRESWGLRSLAYRIKKNRKGHYVLFNIDGPSSAVLEMERQMCLSEDILRYLTVKVDELEEGPSIIMQRGGRDERSRRDDRRGDRRDERPVRAKTKGEDEAKAEGEAEDVVKDQAKAKSKAEGDDKGEAKVKGKAEDVVKGEAKAKGKAEDVVKGEAKAKGKAEGDDKGEAKAKSKARTEGDDKGEAKSDKQPRSAEKDGAGDKGENPGEDQ